MADMDPGLRGEGVPFTTGSLRAQRSNLVPIGPLGPRLRRRLRLLAMTRISRVENLH
jgi:hypothetical protein